MVEKWEELAELRASGYSIRDAASELGMPEKTAYGYSAKAEFKAAVKTIQTERAEKLSGIFSDAATGAIEQLKILSTTAEKESDQISACKVILDKYLTVFENLELRRRIDDLEQRAAETAGETGEQDSVPAERA